MLRFDQMPQALLYSRNKRIPEEADNRMLFGLMLPTLLHEDVNGIWKRYKYQNIVMRRERFRQSIENMHFRDLSILFYFR